MNRKIKEWYAEQKPDDIIVKSGLINDNVTFEDVYNALTEKKDIYDTMGCNSRAAEAIRNNADSLRKYIFSELAEINKCSYEDIYRLFLDKRYSSLQKNEIPFSISVPVNATVEVDIIGNDISSSVEYFKSALENIDCGVLENIEFVNPLDHEKTLDDFENQTEELEKIISLNLVVGQDPLSIKIPVRADFVIEVVSDTLENAVEKVKRNIQNLKIEKAGDLTITDIDNSNIGNTKDSSEINIEHTEFEKI